VEISGIVQNEGARRIAWDPPTRQTELSFVGRKMTDSILMQYLGFKSKSQWREYSFQVRYAAEDVRDFTLTILNEAFTSHRVRYQDAPDVCSLKLRRELVANADLPSNTNFAVSDNELDDYNAGHFKATHRLYQPKRREDY
jgi:hypothetical protein